MTLLRGQEEAHPGTEALMSWAEEDGTVGVLVENWTGLYRAWFNRVSENHYDVVGVENADGRKLDRGARYDRVVDCALGYVLAGADARVDAEPAA